MSIRDILKVNIRNIRKLKGLSQEQFAELCNISVSYLAHIEIGDSLPSLDFLQKIVDSCKIQPYELFWEKEIYENTAIHDSIKIEQIKRHLHDILDILE